jgi:hypothetical protein
MISTHNTTRVYTCNELGVCQLRTPRCPGCTVTHIYPPPKKPLRLAPGAIDFGAKRARLEWRTALRSQAAWEFLKGLALTGAALIVLMFLLGITGWGPRFLAMLGQ